MKEILNSFPAIAPVPVVLVSAGNAEEANIATVAWSGVMSSEPAIVYISLRPTRYTHAIITKTKEFVINLPSDNLVYEVDLCGTKSGKEFDKFVMCKFTKGVANVVSTVIIKECPVNIECKVKEIKNLGSHDLFISEIVSISANKEIILPSKRIDYEKAKLLTYADGKYFSNNKMLAERGICIKRDLNI